MSKRNVSDPSLHGWTEENGKWVWEGTDSGAGMIISETEPDAVDGTQWLNALTGEVFIYDDGKWLEFPGGKDGAAGADGKQIWSEVTPDGNIYYDKGSVGIGTDNPWGGKLHINGNVYVEGRGDSSAIEFADWKIYNGDVGDGQFFNIASRTGGDFFNINSSGNATFSGGSFSPSSNGGWTNGALTTTGTFGGGISLIDGSAGFGIWAQGGGSELVIGHGSTSGNLSSDITLDASGNATFSGAVRSIGNVNTGIWGIWRSSSDHCGLGFSHVGALRHVVPLDESGLPIDGSVSLGNPNSQNFQNAYFSGTVTSQNTRSQRVIQDGSPVIDAKGLIKTLTTLRQATMDETQDIRESLRSAIDELVEGFEQEISTMEESE